MLNKIQIIRGNNYYNNWNNNGRMNKLMPVYNICCNKA